MYFKKSIELIDKEEDGEGKVVEESERVQELDIADFFKEDYFTGDYIHYTVLKSNPNDNMKGEKLHIEASPSIGYAGKHAAYSPVAAVGFKYVQDTDEIKDLIFNKTMYNKILNVKQKVLNH